MEGVDCYITIQGYRGCSKINNPSMQQTSEMRHNCTPESTQLQEHIACVLLCQNSPMTWDSFRLSLIMWSLRVQRALARLPLFCWITSGENQWWALIGTEELKWPCSCTAKAGSTEPRYCELASKSLTYLKTKRKGKLHNGLSNNITTEILQCWAN